MRKIQASLLAFAVAYSCTSNTTLAAGNQDDKFKTHSGTECEQSYNSGKEFSVDVEHIPETDEQKVIFRFTMELGRGAIEDRRINCRQVMLYEQDRMYLENERLRLELELLKKNVEQQLNAKPGDNVEAPAPAADADDW